MKTRHSPKGDENNTRGKAWAKDLKSFSKAKQEEQDGK